MGEIVKPLRYENEADVHRRLFNTLIKYKGRAVFVIHCFENLYIDGVDIGAKGYSDDKQAEFTVKFHSSDSDLDLESPELGWANISVARVTRPIFFLRSPTRQFSQGVDLRRVYWFDPLSKKENILQRGYVARYLSDYSPIARMINGEEQHDIEEAAHSPYGLPLNRRWALVNPSASKNTNPTIFTVYHEANAIGHYNSISRVFFFGEHLLTKTRRNEFEDLRLLNRSHIYESQEQQG